MSGKVVDISEFIQAKHDCQISLPVEGGEGAPFPVSHYFLNGDNAVFQVAPSEVVERTLTHVFDATISDPYKTINDLPDVDGSKKKGWAHPIGAVYDRDYNLIKESQFRNNQILPETTLERPTETKAGTWIFLGYYNEVYGHFILEGLCRLWALDYLKNINAKFFFLPIRNYTVIKGRYTEPFLEKFNDSWSGPKKFTDSIEIITEPVKLEHVIVPSRSFDIQGGPRRDYIDVVDKLIPPPPVLPKPKRYFLSRKELPLAQHKFINEAEIEDVFNHFDFISLNPQNLTLRKQFRAYQSAEYLAGAISSALHNSIFSSDKCHVIAMNGRWPQTGRIAAAKSGKNFPNPVCPQDRICGIREQKLSYIENHRAFHIEGMLSGRMMYFIGPQYCYDLICKITGETPELKGLRNGLSDEAARILLLESIEFALNGKAFSLVNFLIDIYTEYFESSRDYKAQIRRFNHRLGAQAKKQTPDSHKSYTIFPDSDAKNINGIIEDSSDVARAILIKLRSLTDVDE